MENKRNLGQLIARLFGNRPSGSGCDSTVEIGECPPLEFMTIPSGTFWMGSDKQRDTRADDDELPKHEVYLDAYAIGKYPVTNAQYAQFVRSTHHRAPQQWENGQPPPGKEKHPVIEVTWQDAAAFCTWASVRLPTEAEWEKAARGTDGRIFPWGDTEPTVWHDTPPAPWGNAPLASRLCNFDRPPDSGTTIVGGYPSGASPYGVMDMAGNVWEWVSDWYQKDFYKVSPTNNPTGPAAGDYHVYRGGSWFSGLNWVRTACRSYRFFDSTEGAYGFKERGFRCARLR